MDAQLVPNDRYEELKQTLQVIYRLLQEPETSAQQRAWVLQHCRRTAQSEQQLWHALARYREEGPAAVLDDGAARTVFAPQMPLVREKLLRQLIATPRAVVGEFRQLLRFTQELTDRIRFLCDWMLALFVQQDPWLDAYEATQALEVLLHKLTEQLEVLDEIIHLDDPLPAIVLAAQEWLHKRAMVGELGEG